MKPRRRWTTVGSAVVLLFLLLEIPVNVFAASSDCVPIPAQSQKSSMEYILDQIRNKINHPDLITVGATITLVGVIMKEQSVSRPIAIAGAAVTLLGSIFDNKEVVAEVEHKTSLELCPDVTSPTPNFFLGPSGLSKELAKGMPSNGFISDKQGLTLTTKDINTILGSCATCKLIEPEQDDLRKLYKAPRKPEQDDLSRIYKTPPVQTPPTHPLP